MMATELESDQKTSSRLVVALELIAGQSFVLFVFSLVLHRWSSPSVYWCLSVVLMESLLASVTHSNPNHQENRLSVELNESLMVDSQYRCLTFVIEHVDHKSDVMHSLMQLSGLVVLECVVARRNDDDNILNLLLDQTRLLDANEHYKWHKRSSPNEK